LFLSKINFVNWLPAVINILVSIALIYLVSKFIARKNRLDSENTWLRQIAFVFLIIFCVVGVIVSFPIATETRGQILNLLGIAFTAVIALSSTSFVGNLMSALMLKVIGGIRPGDFLTVGEHTGRVSEQGLLHTEIQTEDRTLTTIPNMFLINNPHTVVRSTGTIISAKVSLGYDVSRFKIEKALIEAAQRSGLKEAYVQVMDLGDFSITYRIAGFLEKIKFVISSRASLRAHILDVLHENEIEIVSPNFMNQRQLDPNKEFIPQVNYYERKETEHLSKKPEDLIFDKADEAESKESIKANCEKIKNKISEIKEKLKDEEITDEDKAKAAKRIEDLIKREERLLEMLKKLD